MESSWAERALAQFNFALAEAEEEGWMHRYSGDGRRHYRELGLRLLGLVVPAIGNGVVGQPLLGEARAIGKAHAAAALRCRLSLTDSLRGVLVWRNSWLEAAYALPSPRAAYPAGGIRIIRSVITMLDVVELAVGEQYERTR